MLDSTHEDAAAGEEEGPAGENTPLLLLLLLLLLLNIEPKPKKPPPPAPPFPLPPLPPLLPTGTHRIFRTTFVCTLVWVI
jgi:hypothetical protein